MLSFEQQLAGMAAVLLGEDAPAALFDASSPARIAAYRNNHVGNRVEALKGAYPILQQLLGEEFFQALAQRFVCDHLSESGNLHDYGSGLADFLQTFPPVADYPYLSDVACLEWQLHRAYYAPDRTGLSPVALAACPPQQIAQLRFVLHPSVALLDSPWPLTAIWAAHQPGLDEVPEVDLGQGGGAVRVWREGLQLHVESITAAEAAFMQAVMQHQPFAEALNAALHCDAGFEPGPLLQDWMHRAILCEAHWSEEE